jgi:hypothetical protein
MLSLLRELCGSLNHESSAADLIYDKAGLCNSASVGVWRSAGTPDAFPQGGFVTRKPTVDILASRSVQGDGFFGFFFQPNPDTQPGNARQRGGQSYRQRQQGWW